MSTTITILLIVGFVLAILVILLVVRARNKSVEQFERQRVELAAKWRKRQAGGRG